MDKILEFIEKFQKQFLVFWASLSVSQKVGLIGSGIAISGVLIGIVAVKSRSDYQYLFTDVDVEDRSEIAKFLAKNNYDDYTIDSRGIKVNANDVDRLRLQLSQEGLPAKGTVGWEQFDEESFARTEFEQEVLKLRAIQGELSRTISSIDGVRSARVHIVMPKRSLFVRDSKEPSAAIYLSLARGFELGKKQIKGIQFLVSKSVEGLDTNQIVIVDSSGNSLTLEEPSDFATKQSQQLLEYKRNLEKALESRIRTLVGKIVGYDRIDAKVDAQVDFTLEKKTSSDVDPEDVVVVSKNTSGFSMEGQGLNPTGIPGSKSNVPGEQEDFVKGGGAKTGSKRDSEVINYEYSKTVSEKTMAVGKIMRLTVSVIVDGKQTYPPGGATPKFEPRTPEEMKKIEDLIKNAVGFKAERDSLTVHNMMFQLDTAQIMAINQKEDQDRQYTSTLAISAVIALALLLFFAFVVRPYFRWLSYDPERKEARAIVEEYKPEIETAKLQRVKVQEDVPFDKMTPKEQVMYLAKNDPRRTTEAIRLLLNPSSGG